MKNKKGISLIVLSITILVMAILAATAIIALEDSGIIKRSKDTVKNNNYSDELTRLVVIKNGILTDNLGTITVDEYITELQNKGLIESTIVENADGSKTVTTKTGFEVKLAQNGTSDLSIAIEGYTQNNMANNNNSSSGDDNTGNNDDTTSGNTTKVSLTNGAGTSSSPYTIATVDELVSLATQVNSGYSTSGVYFSLDTDLDLSTIANWESIGNSEATAFDGIFEGAGHTITGLNSINGGMFGYSYGTIKNLMLSNCVITNSSECTGTLVNRNYGTITTIGLYNSNVEGTNYIGGVVGVNGETGDVSIILSENCLIKGEDYVGLMIGQNSGTVTEAYINNGEVIGDSVASVCIGQNNGTVTTVEFRGGTVEGTNYIGGVIGINGENGNVSHIATSQECFVTGEDYVGVIIGQNNGTVTAATVDSGEVTGNSMVSLCIGQNNGTVTNVNINWGTAEGTSIVGACVGKNNGTLTNITINAGTAIADSIVGLFAGQNTAILTESYIYGGTATGNSIVGNFVGDNSGEITNCYTYSDVTADEFTGRNTGTISNCEVIN